MTTQDIDLRFFSLRARVHTDVPEGARYTRDLFAPWTLSEELARHGALVVSSSAEASPPDDFTAEPVLTPPVAHEGVRGLLGQFRGTVALPSRVGRLKKMVELIQEFGQPQA